MAAILEDGRLRLTGYVGDYYFDDGFTSNDVVLGLALIDDEAPLDVYLNSGGGVASEGAAIHALLSARRGTTNIIVEGIAASAASLIAMAGDTVSMSLGAVLMIHDPQNITVGDSAAHFKMIDQLEAYATAYARIYSIKSGKTPEACREIMKAESWYSPEDAVADGFADKVIERKSVAVAAYDYRAFAHAPPELVTLARKKKWQAPPGSPEASMNQNLEQMESKVTDKERADQLAAENAQLKTDLEAAKTSAATAVATAMERRTSIMALDEAKGRETLAEHLFNTGMSVDDAKVTLASAPAAVADTTQTPTNDYERTRLEASRLVTPTGGKPAPTARVDIVADMKRRHGIS